MSLRVFLAAFAAAGVAWSQPVPDTAPVPAWIKGAEVTVYRIRMARAGPEQQAFHGHQILCTQVLSEAQRSRLVDFLARSDERRKQSEAEASRQGVAQGAVPGGVKMRYAISFRSPDHVLDTWVCDGCQRLDSFERTPKGDLLLRFVFNPEEGQWLDSFLREVLPCPEAGGG
jgi:hypothetical protein